VIDHFSQWQPRAPRTAPGSLYSPGFSCARTSHKSSEKLTAMRKDKKLGAKILSRKK